jgi:tetratricopeptide (TPR) repeat protein/class 3 adenylate cyclase
MDAHNSGPAPNLEMAYVLFMDIVAYSTLHTDQQQRVLSTLQEAVRNTAEFTRAQAEDQLIRLPTGDGMALVFFRDPEAPARCALELSRKLREHPDVKVRMGIHSGPVYRIADINANRNVAGGGINVAQRVMDCGDAGHVLVSKATADVLAQLKAWDGTLHDLGETEVKHKLRLHLFNLWTDEVGNGERPAKLRTEWKTSVGTVVAAAAVVAVVAGAVGAWLLHGPKAHALNVADTVLLADFENQTGDTVFDDTLKQALSIGLRQSPFLNIVSEEKVGATLKLMTRAADTRITPQVARDVCERANSKAYIAGQIARLGNQYVIGLNAVNCQTGEMLAQQQSKAAGKEKVLDALGNASTKLREELGESLSTVEKFATPLADATTPSLDALKAYSLGLIKTRHNDADAIPFFKRAIDLDSNFASAYEALATSYYNLGESRLARENFTKAFELSARTSERERFVIAARYYQLDTGELEKAISNYELWAQAYPRDARVHGNLGGLYGATGRFENAVAETLEALRLTPDSGANYANLVLSYASLNRLDDAKAMYDKAVARGVADDPLMRVNYFGLRSARDYSRRATDSALRNNEKDTAAQWMLSAAVREAEFDNSERARRAAASALALSTNHDSEILAALTFARAGDRLQAEKLAKALASDYPRDTLVIRYWLPAIRAAIEIDGKNPSRALEVVEPSAAYELASPDAWPGLGGPLYPIYLRGEARLALREGSEAAGEFQKLLDHRGLMRACPLGPLAHLGLARAYAMQGETAKARAAYLDFLNLWKDADPDTPILIAAKAESAKLN